MYTFFNCVKIIIGDNMKKVSGFFLVIAIILIVSGIVINNRYKPKKDIINETYENNDNYQSVSFNVRYAETPLSIYTKNFINFEGLKDTVSGSKITKNSAKGIIGSVSSATDFGSMYNAWYDIEGNDVKQATYVVEGITNKEQEATIGINYYDSALNVTLKEARSIEYQYQKSILLNNIKGDFTVTFSNYDKNIDLWGIGNNNIDFDFTLEDEATVFVSWEEDSFSITSEQEIESLTIVLSDHYNDEPLNEYQVDKVKNNYKVVVQNNEITVE